MAQEARTLGEPTEAEAASFVLGQKIRHLRKARGLSVKDLSAAAGLSIGFVSQIERGLSSASVRTLARLADALSVGIGELFTDTADESGHPATIVARAFEHRTLDMKSTGATKRWLTPFARVPRLDLYLIELEPGGSSGDQAYIHEGEEAGLVLEGGLELVVDGRRYVLGEGDTFRFASDRPHRFANAGAKPVRVIWVNYRETGSAGTSSAPGSKS
ncbi:cupin domain-containing protein [Alsobacter sp. SYSU M60028]|uniref:Cupin domain-containing protein n=1 Tax=Alsobacter ponti TaxID=2962936 RepID=A0ABT1LHR7_9HYPH|nr:cupin domain-containing protein [Alsobacter ponti]MCP8941056.1 cupin domain-containing protein [Alsobacter ponti]